MRSTRVPRVTEPVPFVNYIRIEIIEDFHILVKWVTEGRSSLSLPEIPSGPRSLTILRSGSNRPPVDGELLITLPWGPSLPKSACFHAGNYNSPPTPWDGKPERKCYPFPRTK